MRFAVFGTGGVGGYYGVRLAQAGHDVTFIARGAHLLAIREHGLRLVSPLGDALIRPARASDRPAEAGPVDWVVCGVKAWQVPEAAEAMRPLVGADTAVLPLQNGVDAAERLASVLGAGHVVGAATWIAAHVEAPGVIRHDTVEPRVVTGELGGGPSPRCERLCAALREAGVRAEVSPDVQAVLWSKFLFISAVSGLGAATRRPVGDFRALPETRALLVAALEEAAAVGRAHGVRLPDDVVATALSFVDGLAPEATASMARDIAAGRPSELEAQTGAVARRGRARGVSTPTHDALYALLLPQELRARAASSS